MKIRLLSFAVLRDITGSAEAELEVAEGTRAGDVWQLLRGRYAALAGVEQPMTAINESYAAPDAVLHDGDELAFIPPVAGG